jgi:hypothetical protein
MFYFDLSFQYFVGVQSLKLLYKKKLSYLLFGSAQKESDHLANPQLAWHSYPFKIQ